MNPILLSMAATLVCGPACAGGNPDAARGVVADHCTACHEVPGYAAPHGRAAVDAPSFQSMADRPETYSDARMRAVLLQPHYLMNQFILSPSDIDNLVAFIRALHKE